ncbi:glycyl radical enzyme domain-containing protein [Escherichia coli]
MDEGVICDMFEGHAPYKPRYVLPITPVSGKRFRMAGAGRRKDLDDALSLLTIL